MNIRSLENKRFVNLACKLSIFTAAIAVGHEAVASSKLDQIQEEGVIRVGVLDDFKPFSFRDTSGNMQGISVELAKDVANTLGVEFEPVVVTSANRMQFLDQGRIDLIIAGMSDRPERREKVGIIEPSYGASGPTLMAKEGVIETWEDISGKPVCGKQGAFYNSLIEREFGTTVVAFTGNAEAKAALRAGRCIAWLYDDAGIINTLVSEDWQGYEMPVDPKYVNPWAMAVLKDELESSYGTLVTGLAYRWHASGKIQELAKEWDLQATSWIDQMHDKMKQDTSYLEY